MSTRAPFAPLQPLELTRRLGIPLDEVSLRLRVSENWLRQLAKNPLHRDRVLLAELEVATEHVRLKTSLSSLLPPRMRT